MIYLSGWRQRPIRRDTWPHTPPTSLTPHLNPEQQQPKRHLCVTTSAPKSDSCAWTSLRPTASSLIKVDAECHKLSDSPYPVNPAGFTIHSAIHAVRGDAGCVLHTHTRAGVGVAAQRDGVLPISQQSTFVLASLAYHRYEGVAFREDEKPRLQADLGHKNFLMLRNHGLLTMGRSIADAFLHMYLFESTCQIQLAAQSGGVALTEVHPEIVQGVAHAMKVQTGGMGGAFVWPALIRKLDRIDTGWRA